MPGLGELLTRELTLDLFERPPQRERIRVEAVRLAAEHVPQRQIAARLTDERPKLPVVQQALALDRKMKELGLETPVCPGDGAAGGLSEAPPPQESEVQLPAARGLRAPGDLTS